METERKREISPLLTDLKSYKPAWLPADIVAGLSVAAVQVPTAIAYAQLAGFSPEIGLYASILPVIVYAFLGTSRQLVVGPDAATCTMVAALMMPLAAGDPSKYLSLSAGLSLIAGVLMIIGGACKVGFIVNFFSRPILVGFLNGIAVSIIVGQLGKFLGVKLDHHDFFPSLCEVATELTQTHMPTLMVGAATMVLLFLLKRFAPKAPSSLIALAAATVGLIYLGGPSPGVAQVGSIPAGLPSLWLPQFNYHAGQGIVVSAIGLVIVSFTSGMLTARSFAARAGQTIDANQEMWALGAANLAAGFSGAFAITGADSRTAVNSSSGSKTQLSAVFAALATAAVAAWFSGPLALLPISALAAVLIFSAISLLDFASYKELKQVDKIEFNLSLLTTAGVLALGVLPGVAVAILLALLVILFRIYKSDDTILGVVPGLDGYNDLALSPDAKPVADVVIWRFEGPLVFFNADHFKARVKLVISNQQSRPRWLVISMESVSQLDATGLKALEELCLELRKDETEVLIARPKTFMRSLRKDTHLAEHLDAESVFPTVGAAMAAIAERKDGSTSASAGSYKTFFANLEAGNETTRQTVETPGNGEDNTRSDENNTDNETGDQLANGTDNKSVSEAGSETGKES